MDDTFLGSLFALLALLAFHAWMEFSYAVLTNYRRTALAERSEAGDRQARLILKLSEDLPRLYVTTQLVQMLIRFGFVAIATVNFADPVISADPTMTTLGRVSVYAVILLPIALIVYFVGDLVPSAFGQVYADRALKIVTAFERPLVYALTPLVSAMMWLNGVIAKASGAESLKKVVTEEEIMTLVDVGEQSGAIEDEEREMIYSVLQFGETLAREVMVPRPDITGLEIDTSLQEALGVVIDSGHSRIPVYEDTVDDIKGMLYAKDLLALWHKGGSEVTTVRQLMRAAYFVPETKRCDVLFKEMQASKSHIAVVVDEYGGVAGLVTIEDLLEEIVGDIKDEHDFNEEIEYIELGEGDYRVDGGMNVGDLNEMMDLNLPTEDSDSLGGFIYSQLGRVPEVDEVIELPELRVRMTVESIENRRIRKVHVEVLPPPTDDDDEDDAPDAKDVRETREQKAARESKEAGA
ncbi:MAG: hemolysin family protein [Pleurocapsa minor GSE-CHR-MK-17-07R]|nr:hemolysin family protein [Pleurocapsa minor GSE-CHR-MK 17-07R]